MHISITLIRQIAELRHCKQAFKISDSDHGEFQDIITQSI